MRRYEYKFIRETKNLGSDFNRKIEETEQEWNALGNRDGNSSKRATAS